MSGKGQTAILQEVGTRRTEMAFLLFVAGFAVATILTRIATLPAPIAGHSGISLMTCTPDEASTQQNSGKLFFVNCGGFF